MRRHFHTNIAQHCIYSTKIMSRLKRLKQRNFSMHFVLDFGLDLHCIIEMYNFTFLIRNEHLASTLPLPEIFGLLLLYCVRNERFFVIVVEH